MLRKREATQSGSVVSILAGCSGASKGRSSPCSLRCAWLRSRFAPLTRPLLPAELTAGRLQGMVLSVSPGNGRLITTVVLRQRQRATTLGSIWLRQCPSASGAFLGEATRPAIRAVARYLAVRTARQQLSACLLRHERIYPNGGKAWTKAHRGWLANQSFAQPAQQIVLGNSPTATRGSLFSPRNSG